MKVIIVGGGKVGSHLAAMLVNGGHSVCVIEQRGDHVSAIKRELPQALVLHGSGTQPSFLEKAGVQEANVVAAVTGADETNLVITSLARFEFGVARTIARINNPKNAWIFSPELGVDVALNQADVMAHLIAEEMSLGDMMTLLKLRQGQYSLVEEKVHPTASANGKALRDLHLPSECVIAAVIRKGELIIPRGSTVLQAADEVLAVVHDDALDQLANLLGKSS